MRSSATRPRPPPRSRGTRRPGPSSVVAPFAPALRLVAVQERRARRLTMALAASFLLTAAVVGAGWRWIAYDRTARRGRPAARVNRALSGAAPPRGERPR